MEPHRSARHHGEQAHRAVGRRHPGSAWGFIATLAVALGAALSGLHLAVGPGGGSATAGSLSASSLPDEPASAGNTAAPELVDEGPAPSFSLSTLDGDRLSAGSLEGSTVVLYFMAASCPSCVPEARALGRIHEEYADRGVRILAVDVETFSTEDELRRFARETGDSGHDWALDRRGELALAFDAFSLETTVVIDPSGKIVFRDDSTTTYERLRAILEQVAA